MTLDCLSERQRQLAIMVRCGYTNNEIAQQLGISPLVVRNHLRAVYRALGITGAKGARRAKLAMEALRREIRACAFDANVAMMDKQAPPHMQKQLAKHKELAEALQAIEEMLRGEQGEMGI